MINSLTRSERRALEDNVESEENGPKGTIFLGRANATEATGAVPWRNDRAFHIYGNSARRFQVPRQTAGCHPRLNPRVDFHPQPATLFCSFLLPLCAPLLLFYLLGACLWKIHTFLVLFSFYPFRDFSRICKQNCVFPIIRQYERPTNGANK